VRRQPLLKRQSALLHHRGASLQRHDGPAEDHLDVHRVPAFFRRALQQALSAIEDPSDELDVLNVVAARLAGEPRKHGLENTSGGFSQERAAQVVEHSQDRVGVQRPRIIYVGVLEALQDTEGGELHAGLGGCWTSATKGQDPAAEGLFSPSHARAREGHAALSSRSSWLSCSGTRAELA